jgi:putative transposase
MKRLTKCAVILKPSSFLRFHKLLVWFGSKNRRRPGPKGPSKDVIAAVVEMKHRNPHLGCRKIAEQIAHSFGIAIDKDVVRRILAKHYRPEKDGDGISWLTAIAHAKDSLWSIDLFRCESILLQGYWVMVVMDVFSRGIIGFGVQRGDLDGVAVCRMFNQARAGHALPTYVSTDNDPLFRFHRWLGNLRVLDIEEVKSVPFVPQLHCFVERLIGTLRRERLDCLFFWNGVDLERKLLDYRDYYNEHRCHTGLEGKTPKAFGTDQATTCASLQSYRWIGYCQSMFQLPAIA